MAPAIAVAIVETPDTFVMQGTLDGPAKLRFFGGGINPGEDATDAIRRELGEELDHQPMGPLELVDEVTDLRSESRAGAIAARHVSLFRVLVESARDFELEAGDNMVEIPKNLASLHANRHLLTEFAYNSLVRRLTPREQ